jgi:aerobic-type carbon monoxide dehydrogenase small subunit (CoxS/CutS family)
MPELLVNGERYELDAPILRTLAEALREDLDLTGTKVACGEEHCEIARALVRGALGALGL